MAFFHRTTRPDGGHDDTKSNDSCNICIQLDNWNGCHDVPCDSTNGTALQPYGIQRP